MVTFLIGLIVLALAVCYSLPSTQEEEEAWRRAQPPRH